MNMTKDNIVPLFKTFEQLQTDECEILACFEKEWDAAWQDFELARAAVLAEDKTTSLAKIVDTTPSPLAVLKKSGALHKLAKLDPALASQFEKLSTEFAIAVAQNNRLRKTMNARREVIQALENAQKAALDKRDGMLWGFGKLAKRSQRFASAHASKNYGPGAASLPPAS